eukprot:09008.XXX_220066_220629_1 [CDS] Oithona nana genome sequencing.
MFDRLLRATLGFMLILICINALQAGNAAEIIRRKSFPRPQKLINERVPRSAYDNAIRGQSKIHALRTSQITHLLKVIDQVREGQVNIRDLDRRDMNSINSLMKSYGMLHQQ